MRLVLSSLVCTTTTTRTPLRSPYRLNMAIPPAAGEVGIASLSVPLRAELWAERLRKSLPIVLLWGDAPPSGLISPTERHSPSGTLYGQLCGSWLQAARFEKTHPSCMQQRTEAALRGRFEERPAAHSGSHSSSAGAMERRRRIAVSTCSVCRRRADCVLPSKAMVSPGSTSGRVLKGSGSAPHTREQVRCRPSEQRAVAA